MVKSLTLKSFSSFFHFWGRSQSQSQSQSDNENENQIEDQVQITKLRPIEKNAVKTINSNLNKYKDYL